jgi:hypothetical protein
MKQPFFSGISPWSQFRIYFARHRKHVNENLGLIVALLAAAFAGLSGWEAYRARIDALLGLKIAQRSYIEIKDVKSAVSWKGYADGSSRIDYSFVVKAYGNSPAFQIRQAVTCDRGLRLELQYPPTSAEKPLSAESWGPNESFLHLVAAHLPSGSEEEVYGSCPYSKDGWVLNGVVFYNDVFGDSNYIHLCYVAYPVEGMIGGIALPTDKTEPTKVTLSPCWRFNDVNPVK